MPSLLPDETLYSLASRIAIINGISDCQAICETLFGKDKAPRVADIEVNLDKFNKVTRNSYGSNQQITNTTTIIPFLKSLGWGTTQNNEKINCELNANRKLSELSNAEPHKWKWCNDCIEADIEKYGFTYWHRSHQISGVFACIKHQATLYEVDIPFRDRQQHFIIPTTVKEYQAPHPCCVSNEEIKMASKLATFSIESLTNYKEIFDSSIFNTFIKHQLKMHQQLVNAGLKSSFSELLKQLPAAAKSSLPSNLNKFYSGIKPYNLQNRLLVVYWLFGSWQLVNEYYLWSEIFSAHLLDDLTNLKKSKEKNHYDICNEFLKHNKSSTRTSFWKTHPKSCKWLNENDSNWLEGLLPSNSKHPTYQLRLL